MCFNTRHGPRGPYGPSNQDKSMITCPQCQVIKTTWDFKESSFVYSERWNSHYCQDCNLWVESSSCQEGNSPNGSCDQTCPYFGRPERPFSHDN